MNNTYKKFAKYYDFYTKDFDDDIPLYIDNNSQDEILTKREFIDKSQMTELLFETGFKDIELTDYYDLNVFHKLNKNEKTNNSYVVKGIK